MRSVRRMFACVHDYGTRSLVPVLAKCVYFELRCHPPIAADDDDQPDDDDQLVYLGGEDRGLGVSDGV